MMGEIGEIGKYVAHASLKWHSRPTLSLLFHQRGTSQSESVGWSDRPSVGRRCPCQNECGCQLKSTIISSSSALKRRWQRRRKLKLNSVMEPPKGLLVMGTYCALSSTGRSHSQSYMYRADGVDGPQEMERK